MDGRATQGAKRVQREHERRRRDVEHRASVEAQGHIRGGTAQIEAEARDRENIQEERFRGRDGSEIEAATDVETTPIASVNLNPEHATEIEVERIGRGDRDERLQGDLAGEIEPNAHGAFGTRARHERGIAKAEAGAAVGGGDFNGGFSFHIRGCLNGEGGS